MAPTGPSRHAEHDGRAAAIAFLWILIAFKVVTMALIFVHLRTTTSFLILLSTFWYWLPVVGFLVGGPLLFRYRLVRQRRRREQLRRAEWMIEPEQTVTEMPLPRP